MDTYFILERREYKFSITIYLFIVEVFSQNFVVTSLHFLARLISGNSLADPERKIVPRDAELCQRCTISIERALGFARIRSRGTPRAARKFVIQCRVIARGLV